MDFMNRIEQIQSRIADIESQASSVSAPPGGDVSADFQQVLDEQLNKQNGTAALPAGVTAWVPGTPPSGLADASATPTAPGTANTQFDDVVAQAASQYGVDPNLVKSVIQQESGFNPKAVSNCGAMGLMQLMPATAHDLGCADAYDPQQNVAAGTKYLKQLLDQFHGDTSMALAAYNAGPDNVRKYNGIPPFAETQNYVKNILGFYATYKRGS